MTTFDRYLPLKRCRTPLGAGMGLAFVVIAFVQLIQISDSTTGFGVTSRFSHGGFVQSATNHRTASIPIGLLFATLITLGRLEQDNELLAHSASGFFSHAFDPRPSYLSGHSERYLRHRDCIRRAMGSLDFVIS